MQEGGGGDALAAAVFALASFTDALDGWIARRQKSVSTFGKLMDPLADKLLVTAALVSLVSLDRLSAWVAMVIIAREFAVTGLRQLAMEHGEVIPASIWGKLKTVAQVAMVLVLIIVDDSPAWVDALVWLTTAITVVSRRRLLLRLPLADPGPPGPPRSRLIPAQRAVEPLPQRHVVRGVLARGDLRAQLAQQPEALGLHVVLVDRLEVLLAGGDEVVVGEEVEPLRSGGSTSSRGWIEGLWTPPTAQVAGVATVTPRIISRTQSSTKRGRRWAFSTTAPSSERFISS